MEFFILRDDIYCFDRIYEFRLQCLMKLRLGEIGVGNKRNSYITQEVIG